MAIEQPLQLGRARLGRRSGPRRASPGHRAHGEPAGSGSRVGSRSTSSCSPTSGNGRLAPHAAYDLTAPYSPKGDPAAIKQLVAGVNSGELSDALGDGRETFDGHVIAQTGRPTLVLAHNKALAAQLCNGWEFFECVEYFISYYDYYQPEAYVPVSDTHIAKTASINEESTCCSSATRSCLNAAT